VVEGVGLGEAGVVDQAERFHVHGLDLLEREWIEDTQLVLHVQEDDHL
jgi:hypothetical protein